MAYNGRQYETCRFETQNFKLKNKLNMKNKLSIKQRIKACFILLVSGSYSVNSEALDSQDFYEVMQCYRHSPMAEQHNIVRAFEDVKQWIRDNYR